MGLSRIAPSLLACVLVACAGTGSSDKSQSTIAPGASSQTSTGAQTGAAMQLPRYHWKLQDARASSGGRIDALFARVDKPVTLDFHDGQVNVRNACNGIGGSYTVDGGAITFGPMMGTMMACADSKLTVLDGAITTRFSGKAAFVLGTGDAPSLKLTLANGDVLTLVGEETAETKYGGPGKQVFLEIAPQRVACNHPLIPNHQCLNVRELVYGTNGVKSSRGQWHPLYEGIEGYDFQAGTRNVLRLKEFQRKNVPADASSTVYVLDMVVESEVAASGKKD
ncbi:META and DUF4377 domain-containing protein [Solilutibacter silvestris]|uniref:META domain-containing protein n=1 Tax=Solilutibacter silvestris TaxID=1645665 RepID=A0A2K1Q0W2_9GAMM|nr:META and DUF4377 domain-containing protein [Lysobacter silvestris]PNS08685.1 hypothetical protein Lysil_0314 [Lysobacter silvestris]